VAKATAPDRERPALRTHALTRDYGGTGLFDVSLTVPRGSVFGLVGPNGAGKTTLLSMVTGLRHADHGTVEIGVEPSRLVVCPDVPEFEPWLTATEVVELARSLLRLPADAEAVADALDRTGLADAARRRVGGFSRGMTQRLGLACALASDPELLILDEPTSALDPAGRADVLAMVAAQRGDRTVIFSSHILADVQRVADRIAILRTGRLLYQGGTQELVDHHLQPRWRVRLASHVDEVLHELERRAWVARVSRVGDAELVVDATTLEAGEAGIPEVVAACGARQVACEPVAADLESAFLALTEDRP
jgi:ABC-2 type transport system ATP-binding protein